MKCVLFAIFFLYCVCNSVLCLFMKMSDLTSSLFMFCLILWKNNVFCSCYFRCFVLQYVALREMSFVILCCFTGNVDILFVFMCGVFVSCFCIVCITLLSSDFYLLSVCRFYFLSIWIFMGNVHGLYHLCF